MLTIEQIRGAVARGWSYPGNSHKIMDPTLAEAISQEILKAQHAAQESKVPVDDHLDSQEN